MRVERFPFLFVVCQAGAESALKREVARHHPFLRPSFSRPGFMTFKSVGDPLAADFELDSVFGRAYGVSIGPAGGRDAKSGSGEGGADGPRIRTLDLLEKARQVLPSEAEGRAVLHVFEREAYPAGEEPAGHDGSAGARWIEGELRRAAGGLFEADSVASVPGQWVLDVIVVEKSEGWLGLHRHSARHSPYPGGKPLLSMPPEAPSRAYLKIEEGLLWSRAPLRRGDTAVEIGSAPGGASYALLRRGIHVVGIDPGEMSPGVLGFTDPSAQFRQIRRPVAQVAREELPARVEWLLADMNVEPRITLSSVDRLGTRLEESLLGVLLTLKLNQWRMADEIPSYLEHLRAMGMVKLRATQLAANRREILVYGLTRKGRTRE